MIISEENLRSLIKSRLLSQSRLNEAFENMPNRDEEGVRDDDNNLVSGWEDVAALLQGEVEFETESGDDVKMELKKWRWADWENDPNGATQWLFDEGGYTYVYQTTAGGTERPTRENTSIAIAGSPREGSRASLSNPIQVPESKEAAFNALWGLFEQWSTEKRNPRARDVVGRANLTERQSKYQSEMDRMWGELDSWSLNSGGTSWYEDKYAYGTWVNGTEFDKEWIMFYIRPYYHVDDEKAYPVIVGGGVKGATDETAADVASWAADAIQDEGTGNVAAADEGKFAEDLGYIIGWMKANGDRYLTSDGSQLWKFSNQVAHYFKEDHGDSLQLSGKFRTPLEQGNGNSWSLRTTTETRLAEVPKSDLEAFGGDEADGNAAYGRWVIER